MKDSHELVERTQSSKKVFDGKLLQVYYDDAKLPDGSTSSREWIKHPGACAVVPIFDNNDIMLIKQFRYPMAQIFYEVPAGKIDPGETPDSTAERELLEEAGLTCERLYYIGHFYPAIGYADEVIHIYAGIGLAQVDSNTDSDEFVVNERLPFTEAMEMISNGEINDGKTIICLQRVWVWLKETFGLRQTK
jgi:ADP-ribose pyrophosphatase